jgi:hypothetical protein
VHVEGFVTSHAMSTMARMAGLHRRIEWREAQELARACNNPSRYRTLHQVGFDTSSLSKIANVVDCIRYSATLFMVLELSRSSKSSRLASDYVDTCTLLVAMLR